MKRILVAVATLLALCILFIAATPVAAGENFSAKVSAVSDGDTLVVRKGRFTHVVQLTGVDAPEVGQAFGSEARAYLTKRLQGQRVEVEVLGETHGRSIEAKVLIDGEDIGLELVKKGFAWAAREQPSAELEQAARRAKAAKEGLWASADPTPPWSYRAAQRAGG